MDFSISQLRPSKPGMGTEVSSGQETPHEHPSGMSHLSRGFCCWELGKGSPWECCFPSLLGEMPTSQNHAWWEGGQQIPENPFPSCALMVTELETLMGKGTLGPKTPIPSHLSSSCMSPLMTGEPSGVSQLPQRQTTHSVTLSFQEEEGA